jgi:Domain of unknown function (DUF4347)
MPPPCPALASIPDPRPHALSLRAPPGSKSSGGKQSGALPARRPVIASAARQSSTPGAQPSARANSSIGSPCPSTVPMALLSGFGAKPAGMRIAEQAFTVFFDGENPGMTRKPEILFVDPSVPDIPTILLGLRPEVEAILLDGKNPAARQMSAALRQRENLDAVHVIAHGAPGQVSFAAGEWSAEALVRDAEDLATVGRALGPGGDLRLWSCETGGGAGGAAFVAALERAADAVVAAASGLVGAGPLGGKWDLARAGTAARPPLTGAGAAGYPGVFSATLTSTAKGERFGIFGRWPVGTPAGTYFIVLNNNGALEVVGKFIVPENMAGTFAISEPIPTGSYTLGSNTAGPGTITVYSGNWTPTDQAEGTWSPGSFNPAITATLNSTRNVASNHSNLLGAVGC